MAIISREELFERLQTGTPWNVPVTILRQSPLPTTSTEVFESLEAAQTYASTSASVYPGQIISVVAADGSNSYYGISQTGTLEELGGAVDVDDKTIAYGTDGTLSLKNFGVKYYRYVTGA